MNPTADVRILTPITVRDEIEDTITVTVTEHLVIRQTLAERLVDGDVAVICRIETRLNPYDHDARWWQTYIERDQSAWTLQAEFEVDLS